MKYSKGPFINLNVQGTHAYPNNLVHQQTLKKRVFFLSTSICLLAFIILHLRLNFAFLNSTPQNSTICRQ